MEKDKQGQPGNYTGSQADIKRFEIDGRPIFESLNIDDMTGEISYKLNPDIEEDLKAAQQGAAQNIAAVIERMLTGNPPYERLQKWQSMLDAFYTETKDGEALVDELRGLRKYIDAEINSGKYEDIKAKAGEKQYTLSELLDLLADPNSEFASILDAARAAKAAADNMPQVRYNTGTDLTASTDKLASLFFSLSAPANIHSGQRTMVNISRRDMIPLQYEKDSEKDITLFYDFNFNEAQLSRLGIGTTFNSLDYFIGAIFDTLYLEGNRRVSLTKVWHELGGKGSPTADQLTPLYKIMVRGLSTTLTMDDKDVQEALGNSPGAKYKEIISPVMPIQILSEKFKANGKVANATIQINQLSPFFMLSQSTGQYATWPKEILQLYSGRKTTRYYSVMHCLMQHIARADGHISYSEFYERNKDKSYRAKELTRTMIYTLLDQVFKPAGYVKTYEEDQGVDPGIIIKCNPGAMIRGDNKLLIEAKQ